MLTLPACLGAAAAEDLKRDLLARAADQTVIDAGQVAQVGSLCLQLLAAARRADPRLRLHPVSETLLTSAASLGLCAALGLEPGPEDDHA